jgi:predicted AlkP superfamily pyrophosphatase or phosphodiesterase
VTRALDGARLLVHDDFMKILSLIILTSILQAYAFAKRPVIFWLSVDGLSPQFIVKTKTPVLNRLIKEGWSSSGLVPVFPSSTFPNHTSQATGVLVEEHGIIGNSFFDLNSKQLHHYPGDIQLMQSEALWETAKRQGLRSAVIYWPLSYASREHGADYVMKEFNPQLSDQARIDQALNIWEKDLDQGKFLSLIMAYIVGPDKLAHQLGPDDPKVLQVVRDTDALIA